MHHKSWCNKKAGKNRPNCCAWVSTSYLTVGRDQLKRNNNTIAHGSCQVYIIGVPDVLISLPIHQFFSDACKSCFLTGSFSPLPWTS